MSTKIYNAYKYTGKDFQQFNKDIKKYRDDVIDKMIDIVYDDYKSLDKKKYSDKGIWGFKIKKNFIELLFCDNEDGHNVCIFFDEENYLFFLKSCNYFCFFIPI